MAKKAKKVRDWGEIDPKLFEEFEKKVNALWDEMIPDDFDGDNPLKVIIVNKMTHEMPFVPIPRNEVYSYERHGYLEFHPDKQAELNNEYERWMGYNAEVANGLIERYFTMRNHRFYEAKTKRDDAKKPIEQRIEESCPLCKKGVPFDPDSNFMAEQYPDYPASMHKGDEGGERCRAIELRRLQWKQNRGIVEKPVVKHYCRKCESLLRDTDSRKGKGDRDHCMNPQCQLFGKDAA